MQLGLGTKIFPAWSAALTLVKTHGVDAASSAAAAVRADNMSDRLDHAVLAMTSFDHAIDNTRKLPVKWFIANAPMYYRGYEVAKQAVNLIVASGVIPGARERVGLQSLNAARDAFDAGVGVARKDQSRYGRHLASGWLEATAEDALAGVSLLKSEPELGRALMSGINQVRLAVAQKRTVDETIVRTVGELFDRAGAELAESIDRGATAATPDAELYQRTGEMLKQVEQAALALLADAPKDVQSAQQRAAG